MLESTSRSESAATRREPLVQPTPRGLYCAAGDFFIDPWLPVDRAVVTHAHTDHASPGSRHYLTSATGVPILHHRVGSEASVQGLRYGETLELRDVKISLHPAGHLLGSSQVRLEHAGEIWVISGDYKTQPDATCEQLEVVRCDTFVTECTFGLPIFRWRPQSEIFADINAWWHANQQENRASVIFAYALGKSQRVLAGLDASLGPILVHGSIARFLPAYRAAGVKLPDVLTNSDVNLPEFKGRGLILAPASTDGTPWLRKFGPIVTASVSGWMQVRGNRRRSGVDRGFVLSDHADWRGLLETIRATGASHVIATHGYTTALARYLSESQPGLKTSTWSTRYESEPLEREDHPEPVQ